MQPGQSPSTSADLSLDIAGAGPAIAGGTLTWNLTISNAGPAAAQAVTLVDTASVEANESIVSAGGPGSTCRITSPATVSCDLGSMPTGSTMTLTVVQSISTARTDNLTNNGFVSSQTPDPVSANDSASAFVPVGPAPAGTSQQNPITATGAGAPVTSAQSQSAAAPATVASAPDPADLGLTTTVNNAFVTVGQSVTFTVTLTNGGPDSTADVTVQDVLPFGFTFVSATSSQGSFDSTTGIWTVGSLADGATTTLSITATATTAGTFSGTARIASSSEPDPNPANNFAFAVVIVANPLRSSAPADIAITKTVNNPNPTVGSTVVFTVTMTNLGPNPSTGSQGQDVLPPGLTFVSATGDGSYNSGTGKWTGNLNMAVGESRTLVITAVVSRAGCFVNTATVIQQAQTDPNTANDSASVTVCTMTAGRADVGVTKTVDNSTPNVGDTVTFGITATNNGPDQATGVAGQDIMTVGLGFLSATPSQGTYNSNNGVWTIGTLNVGASATLTVTAIVDLPTAQTNTFTITNSDQLDPNQANDSASVTLTPQEADLVTGKAVSDPTPNVGDAVTFVLVLGNLGPDTATDVTETDFLPAGLTLVSATPSQGSFDSGTGLWTVGSLANAASATLTVVATVVSPNAQTNTAIVTHSDQFDPDPLNNSASATETPLQADLELTKSVSDPTPNVGDTITFTVTVTNNGPDAATSVTVTDVLPAGLTFVSATPSQGIYVSGTGLWTVGTVNVGTPQTLQIQATVVSANAQTNTATISHSDQFDPDLLNNSASVTATPQQADLALFKSVSNPTPNVGDTITFTITLTNTGPNTATNVTVTDFLPAGLTFASATPSQGIYVSSTGLWTVGTVNVGTPQTLLIAARVVAPNPQANTATISHADQFDPDLSNNSDTASINPQQADLAVTKSVNNPTPNVGDTITFTVTLTNNGPDAATTVTVTDVLPVGLTFVSATPSQGTYVSTTGLWTVGTVSVGTPQTLQIQATVVSASAQTNTATISHSDQFDPDIGNNTNSVTVTPQQADLAVGKVVSNPTPNVGDTVTFTFTLPLVNNGPNPATNVTVTDVLPAGLTFVSATPSQGTYVSTTGLWTVGTVASGTPQTLQISATVVSPNSETNTASVSHSDQFDPDAVNNSSSATVTPQRADLAVTKTVNQSTPNAGSTVIFTIRVTNLGPDTATGVTVTDLLPPGLTFVSATSTLGSYDSSSGVWTLGSALPNGAAATLTLAAIAGPGQQTNTASISHSDQFDPDPANNSASVTIDPPSADLAVSKTVSTNAPHVGDNVTFTVTLINKGPDTATGVTVHDQLPSGLTLVSATPSQGSFIASTAQWAVGTLATGASVTLVVTARVDAPGVLTNTASIAHSDVFDPDLTNNSASVTLTAVPTSTPPPTPTPPPPGGSTPPASGGSTTQPGSGGVTAPVQLSSTSPGGSGVSSSGPISSVLAFTGLEIGRVLFVAAVLILMGLALMVGSRRRNRQSSR